jgi:prevent-host-death family protein
MFILQSININSGGTMKATAKDLRFNSKELIDTVNRGEEVIITFRGKPCAKLVPYEEARVKTAKNELFGVWSDNKDVEDVTKYVRNLRKGRL